MARTVDPNTRPALLVAASELFYARGLAATGVDEVAVAAGLSKPTLYRHFPSKEVLVAAYLEDRHNRLDGELRERLGSVPAPDRPWAVIDWLCDWVSQPDFRGCAFVRAMAELHCDEDIRGQTRNRKRLLRETIASACRQAGMQDHRVVADELLLIVEGAVTVAFVTGRTTEAAATARRLAAKALSCTPPPRAPTQKGRADG